MTGQRVIFFGTPDFAVPSLVQLAQAGYELLVVTQPDRPVGRKREWTGPPVKVAAQSLGLEVVQPERVSATESLLRLSAFQPDVLVTAAYGQLLSAEVLALPRAGALNVHASLLPRWRGAAPIARAILAGDRETGVTLMEMVLALDAGPMVAQVRTRIADTDDSGTVHDRLAQIGAELLVAKLPAYLAGQLTAVAQPTEGVTYAKRILRRDEWIDWDDAGEAVWRRVRGLAPQPGAVTLAGQQPLKIWSATLLERTEALPPGRVLALSSDEVGVVCGDGRVIQLLTVQPAGKRRMAAGDWWRPHQARSHPLTLSKGSEE